MRKPVLLIRSGQAKEWERERGRKTGASSLINDRLLMVVAVVVVVVVVVVEVIITIIGMSSSCMCVCVCR